MTEDEMVGWHHQLNGHGFGWTPRVGDGQSRTRLSSFTFSFHFHTLEKEMETHSSVLAWRIPGTGETESDKTEAT